MQMSMRRGSLIVCLLLAACSKDLSRSEAEKQILAHENVVEWMWYLPLQKQALLKGEDQGYWNYIPSYNKVQIARSIDDAVVDITSEWIQLNSAVQVTVTVTGISDVPSTTNLREARFSWTYPTLPSRLKRFAAVGGDGVAIFRLFDDGWRVERVNITPSSEGFVLTDAEKEGEEVDLATERERRRIALEEDRRQRLLAAEAQARIATARRLEEERVARMIVEAKTPTKTLLAIRFTRSGSINSPIPFVGSEPSQEIILTDVDIRFTTILGQRRAVSFGRPIRFNMRSCSRTALESTDPGRIYLMISDNCNEEMIFTAGNQTQRDDLLTKSAEAIRLWRTRFGNLPSHSFQ